MARYLYAVQGGDIITRLRDDPTTLEPSGKDLALAASAVTIWTLNGTTQLTGLRTANGVGNAFTIGNADVTTISPDEAGRICFWGPDTNPATNGDLWARDVNNRWWLVKPVRDITAIGNALMSAVDAAGARAAIGAISGVAAAGITDASTTGRAVLTGSATDGRTALGLDDTSLNAKIQAFLNANGYHRIFAINPTDALPATASTGDIAARRQTDSTSGFAYTDLGETILNTVGTTVAQTPSASGGTDVVYAHCTSQCTAATVSGGTVAAVPTGVTGGGRTWTKVAGLDQVSGLTQIASSVWKGVPTSGSGTTGAVTATFPAGMDFRGVRLVQASGGAGTVAQSGISGSTSTATPTLTLPGTTDAAHGMLCFYLSNSGSQTIAPATGSPFAALGTPLTATGMTMAAFSAGTGANSIALTSSGVAQKLITLLELS